MGADWQAKPEVAGPVDVDMVDRKIAWDNEQVLRSQAVVVNKQTPGEKIIRSSVQVLPSGKHLATGLGRPNPET